MEENPYKAPAADNKGVRRRKRDWFVILLVVWFGTAALGFLWLLAIWFDPSIKLPD